MKNFIKKITSIMILGTLCISSSIALARKHGDTVWIRDKVSSIMSINRPYIVDEETKPVFNHKQGSDGTYWVWRWQATGTELKIDTPYNLPDVLFNFYCNSLCTYEYFPYFGREVTTSIYQGINIKTLKQFESLQYDLVNLLKNKQQTSIFAFNLSNIQTVSKNRYAGVIALDKYVPLAPIKGVWIRTNNYKITIDKQTGTLFYERLYKWDDKLSIGSWSGHAIWHHRTHICTTTTVVTPKIGDSLPSGCDQPPIHY